MPPKAARPATPATDALRLAGVPFTLHQYMVSRQPDTALSDRPGYGDAAAAALGVDRRRIFKTLVASVDGRLVAAVVAVASELDLKRLAAATGGRRAELAAAVDAERAAGSAVGAISPLGMRRALPTWVDEAAMEWPTVYVSAGRRGLQVELAPGDLVRVAGATLAPIARRR